MYGDMHPTSWVVPQEMPRKTRKGKKILSIGVPAEESGEKRVTLTPDSVAVLVANGHQVYVQKGAGAESSFSDKAYSDGGAVICFSIEDIYSKSEIITKVSPLTPHELTLLRTNQTLLSAVNLGSLTPDYIRVLEKKNITALGFEFLQSKDGTLPLVMSMSEIAGVSSVHIASELLCGTTGGKGILLGGISGVPPATVTIIGAGTVGFYAARTAISMGASVKVIDNEVYKLRRLEHALGVNLYTAVSMYRHIEEAVVGADVVIGAAFRKDDRTPVVVTEDMIASMREGSVAIDVSIDQGGCIETSRLTTHQKPTFEKHGVIHYCVPNIASRVPNTASQALSNIIGPLLVNIGDFGGLDQLIKIDHGVKNGIYVFCKHLTKQPLGALFGMDYVDINLLVASNL